jgi:hypothetical protein
MLIVIVSMQVLTCILTITSRSDGIVQSSSSTSGAIKVDAGVKAKTRKEAQKAKAQARKGSIPIGTVQQSFSRGAPVSASASSASAATVNSTETQYWGSNEVGTF